MSSRGPGGPVQFFWRLGCLPIWGFWPRSKMNAAELEIASTLLYASALEIATINNIYIWGTPGLQNAAGPFQLCVGAALQHVLSHRGDAGAAPAHGWLGPATFGDQVTTNCLLNIYFIWHIFIGIVTTYGEKQKLDIIMLLLAGFWLFGLCWSCVP